jgi:hypothetical protein
LRGSLDTSEAGEKKMIRRQGSAHMKTIIRGVAVAVAVASIAWSSAAGFVTGASIMAFVSFGLLAPGVARADDAPSPCKALKHIVAAAPNGFASMQAGDGQAVARPYGADAHCAANHASYECTWSHGPDAGSAADALEALAADIAACLPDATHDQNTPARQHFTLGARDQRVQITATTTGAAELKLVVSGK